MTKGETIQEISRLLSRYESPQFALNVITDLFVEHVGSQYSAETTRKAKYRKILQNLREEYDA
jgi:hypothetical protein